MPTVEIEKGVPMPKLNRFGRASVYNFAGMDVGDSFVVTKDNADTIRAAASYFKSSNPGWGYLSKTNNGETRLWRTS